MLKSRFDNFVTAIFIMHSIPCYTPIRQMSSGNFFLRFTNQGITLCCEAKQNDGLNMFQHNVLKNLENWHLKIFDQKKWRTLRC